MDLLEFSKQVVVPDDFDARFYEKSHPEVVGFYRQGAIEQGVSNEHRLYFHFVKYGRRGGYFKNSVEQKIVQAFFRHRFDPSHVAGDFDEIFYEKMYRESTQYYQPFCQHNGIQSRERLYHHYKYLKRLSPLMIFKNERELADHFRFIEAPKVKIIPPARLAVVVHAYYEDIWENELSKELKLIDIDFDLYVSVPASNPELARKIKSEFPGSEVLLVDNRGADILPFLEILKGIVAGSRAYDFVLKLHTKKTATGNFLLTTYLRRGCYRNMCGNLGFILSMMRGDDQLGMVGAPHTRIILHREEDYANSRNFDWVRERLGILDDRIDFIFGTMFMIRFEICKELAVGDIIGRDIFQDGHQPDGTTAHAFERIFASVVRDHNKRIALLDELIPIDEG